MCADRVLANVQNPLHLRDPPLVCGINLVIRVWADSDEALQEFAEDFDLTIRERPPFAALGL